MSRTLLGTALAAALTMFGFPPVAQAAAPTAVATPTCAKSDPVVWLNTRSKKYHMRGDVLYGKTTHGRYMCKSAADAMGYKRVHASTGSLKPSSGFDAASPAPEPESSDDDD